jgi:hypothetical protein
MSEVKKLDVTTVVDTELQSLRHVVDLSRNDGIRLVELKFGQHFQQGHAFLEFLGCFGVDAINLYHNYMLVSEITYSVS